MKHTYSFQAKGHVNIRSRHKTTLMTTVEHELTLRGDCIIAVSADIGLAQLPDEIKKAARDSETNITFSMKTKNHSFEAHGKGHPDLTYTDPIDMVARRSSFTCGRTLMISSDKVARDIPEEMLMELRDPETVITVHLIYETP
ncbi:DUF371 domain-containing protein [Candidatus Bathyarchaeota archaeon]|nr:DUF371 domain-containing protein [Candidatus Bathyarchaeota archaeon]